MGRLSPLEKAGISVEPMSSETGRAPRDWSAVAVGYRSDSMVPSGLWDPFHKTTGHLQANMRSKCINSVNRVNERNQRLSKHHVDRHPDLYKESKEVGNTDEDAILTRYWCLCSPLLLPPRRERARAESRHAHCAHTQSVHTHTVNRERERDAMFKKQNKNILP